MKDILSKKKKLTDIETIALTEGCSAILTNKLPPKLKDPGSFTIPCLIDNHYLGKALCDLGARFNLIPLSTFRKLGIADFIILDYEVDNEVPIILGRPFLDTGPTLIDVYKGGLTMRLNDEQVTFSIFEFVHHKDKAECHAVDVLDDLIEEEFYNQSTILPEEIVVASEAESLDNYCSTVEATNIEIKHRWKIESLDLTNRTNPIF
ncbi:uncharacterized protein LOC108459220 [Gossypium arboreum]|uniref:uncharacterized protein LOC108459220 n=1 Tax=Gossypium arboreum TaxID=29729 RepID=UPI0008191633|nr:uncharacterized protein LOC108459220 [Gossypium arboreum]